MMLYRLKIAAVRWPEICRAMSGLTPARTMLRHRRSPEVMRSLSHQARFRAGSLPDLTKFSHLVSLPVEDEWTIHSAGYRTAFHNLTLELCALQ